MVPKAGPHHMPRLGRRFGIRTITAATTHGQVPIFRILSLFVVVHKSVPNRFPAVPAGELNPEGLQVDRFAPQLGQGLPLFCEIQTTSSDR